MTPKDIVTNSYFCPMPWSGIMYNFDGTVKNCIRSSGYIGDIKHNSIEDIVTGTTNVDKQKSIAEQQPVETCRVCYDLEHKKSFDIISDRVFYIRELKPHKNIDLFAPGNFDLQTADIRWSNLCNFACIYCSPQFSSKWASEEGVNTPTPDNTQKEKFKEYILERASTLKHVYLAGGEPLLMKENLELLDAIDPNVNLRINTNLSKVDTQVFERICKFKNVHWIVSVETIEEEFEYIRHGGRWADFVDNLKIINSLGHKVTFNMLHFLLNYSSLFGCVDYLLENGYHPNSFVIGPLTGPSFLDIRHLPQSELTHVKHELEQRIDNKVGFLLENSYRNLLHYVQQPYESNIKNSFQRLREIDQRRGLDSSKIFINLYKLKEYNHG